MHDCIPKETEKTTKPGMKVETGREQQTKTDLLCNAAAVKAQQGCQFAQAEQTP